MVRSTGETNKFSIIHPEFEPPAKMDGSTDNGMDTTPIMVWTLPRKWYGEYPENGTTKKETNKKENIKKDICEIFEFWKVVFNKNEKTLLSDKRARKSKLVLLTVTRLKTSNWQSQIVLSLITMFRADILTSN